MSRGTVMQVAGELKLPPKRYKVGELVAFTGLSRQTIHNYTRWGLIGETAWTEGGHRLYDESVFERLAKIVRLRGEHGVEQMREILDREDASVCSAMGGMTPSEGQA